jgi:hypothetical protein
VKVFVFGAGAPAVAACKVTVKFPGGVLAVVSTVNVTVTGFPAVGLTVLDGAKWQLAPRGRPPGHVIVTVPANAPEADTWKVELVDVPPCVAVTVFGLGAVRSKSTTWSVTGAS